MISQENLFQMIAQENLRTGLISNFSQILTILKLFLYKIISEYDLSIIFNHLLKKDTKNKIGLEAVLEDTGFQKDGSWNFNREVKIVLKLNDDKQKFSKDLFRVRNGGYNFVFPMRLI